MFELIFALGLFVAVAWVVSHSIFLIIRPDYGQDVASRTHDPISTFLQENYGSHFQHGNNVGEDSLRKL